MQFGGGKKIFILGKLGTKLKFWALHPVGNLLENCNFLPRLLFWPMTPLVIIIIEEEANRKKRQAI